MLYLIFKTHVSYTYILIYFEQIRIEQGYLQMDVIVRLLSGEYFKYYLHIFVKFGLGFGFE